MSRLIAAMVVFAPLALAQPPAATKAPVTDEYHGVKVVDDFRWLENWEDPTVKVWSEAQNAHTRGTLDKLGHLPAVRARAQELLSAVSVAYGSPHAAGGRLFAMKMQPPKQQPFLVVMDSAMEPDKARTLVDPNTMTAGVSIDWFHPSPDGSLIAVSLSEGGSESGNVQVFETKTGKKIHETIERVNGGTAGGHLAWANDGKGFFYTRYPRGTERPAADMDFYIQVYFHQLGTPVEKDRFELGKEFPRIAEVQLEVARHGKSAGMVLCSMQNGDGGEFQHYLRQLDGQWGQFTTYADGVKQAVIAPDDHLILLSRKDAPRGRLLRLPITGTVKLDQAKEIVAQGKDSIVNEFFDAANMAVTKDRVYYAVQMGGPSAVRAVTFDGKAAPAPALGEVAAAGSLTVLDGDKLLFGSTTYVAPLRWAIFDPAAPSEGVTTPMSSAFPFGFDKYEVVREFATSKDGTKVPVNIIRARNLKLDGSHPTMVTAYGGYGVNIEPSFRGRNLALLEQGFVWAEANIRGGGEYGADWHLQGNLTKKQNVFDDFIAVVEHMQKRGYTTPAKTAIEGGSNGGLLMGAAMTQRPELLGCVVSHVGIYDMLRVELSSNGAFNITEFGTVKDPAQFKAIHAYSPYHHVKAGTKYPPVLFLTGANDPRVDPMQSRKMTALLQSVGAPAWLRTSGDTGHGGGTPLSERVAQAADVQAFVFHCLGVNHQPAK